MFQSSMHTESKGEIAENFKVLPTPFGEGKASQKIIEVIKSLPAQINLNNP